MSWTLCFIWFDLGYIVEALIVRREGETFPELDGTFSRTQLVSRSPEIGLSESNWDITEPPPGFASEHNFDNLSIKMSEEQEGHQHPYSAWLVLQFLCWCIIHRHYIYDQAKHEIDIKTKNTAIQKHKPLPPDSIFDQVQCSWTRLEPGLGGNKQISPLRNSWGIHQKLSLCNLCTLIFRRLWFPLISNNF